MKTDFGFIGVGQMAGAILNGAFTHSVLEPTNVGLYDINHEKLEDFREIGCHVYSSIEDLAAGSSIVFLSTKPQDFPIVLPEVKKQISSEALVVSIAAGITPDQIRSELYPEQRVVVCMPNTPLLLGAGATGLGRTDNVSDSEFEQIMRLFSSVGVAREVSPELINAVIPVSGSSPAFIYEFARIITEYGVEHGLSPKTAMELLAGTLHGAADMLIKSGKTPEELIKMVCSPGGATIEGMKALETNGFEETIVKACDAMVKRADELSNRSKVDISNIEIQKVSYLSEKYEDILKLRDKVLLAPLGLENPPEETEQGGESEHFAAISEGKVIGTVQLLELDAFVVKIKNMAVDQPAQRGGVGRLLIRAAEERAGEKGYQKITLSARESAVGFYERLGYRTRGTQFLIAGVPHITMYKDLK